MKSFLGILFLLTLSCNSNQSQSDVPNKIDSLQTLHTSGNVQFQKIMVDSLFIGNKTLDKVEVLNNRTDDSIYVDINLFEKQGNEWKKKQAIHFLKDGVSECNPQISDFNNDGYNDLTVVSATAARGANEVRRLFIYDKTLGRLIEMKNSEKYPNMLYNEELDCIDAFLVYGGSSTVFLRISGDSLKEFAQVTAHYGLTVSEFDNEGKENIIMEDTSYKASFVRFKTYKPLKEYGDHPKY